MIPSEGWEGRLADILTGDSPRGEAADDAWVSRANAAVPGPWWDNPHRAALWAMDQALDLGLPLSSARRFGYLVRAHTSGTPWVPREAPGEAHNAPWLSLVRRGLAKRTEGDGDASYRLPARWPDAFLEGGKRPVGYGATIRVALAPTARSACWALTSGRVVAEDASGPTAVACRPVGTAAEVGLVDVPVPGGWVIARF